MKWRFGVVGVFLLWFVPYLVYPAFSVDSLQLLMAVQEGPGADFFDPTEGRPPRDSPQWPVHTFLIAEYFHQREQWRRAQEEYRSLVDWSIRDECGDKNGGKTGGSGLAGIALWRLLQEEPEKIAQDERRSKYLLKTEEDLLKKPAVKDLFSTKSRYRLNLGRFDDDILRRLSALAFHRGDHVRALRLFKKHLKARMTGEFSPLEEDLFNRLKAGERQIAGLALGKRLKRLGKRKAALSWLEAVWQRGATATLRTKAGLELAKLLRTEQRPRRGITQMLDRVVQGMDDTVPVNLQQEVFFERAIRHYNEGPGRDVPRAREDVKTVRSKSSKSADAADALFFSRAVTSGPATCRRRCPIMMN